MINYKLASPVNIGDETITNLQFQELKGKHLRKLPAEIDIGVMMDLAQKLTGQPSIVFDEMSGADVSEVLSIVGKLFKGGQKTGKNT